MVSFVYFNGFSADYPYTYQLWHQSPASITAELIIDLHHYVMFYLILILVIVVVLLLGALTTSILPIKYAVRSIIRRNMRKLFFTLEGFIAGYCIQVEELPLDMITSSFSMGEVLRVEFFNFFINFCLFLFNVFSFLLDLFKNIKFLCFMLYKFLLRMEQQFIYSLVLNTNLYASVMRVHSIPFSEYFDIPSYKDIIYFLLHIPVMFSCTKCISLPVSFLLSIFNRRDFSYYNKRVITLFFFHTKNLTEGHFNFLFWLDFWLYPSVLYFRFHKKFFQNTFVFSSFRLLRSITHSHFLEIFWTLLPSLILIAIAIPSIFVLLMIDEPTGYVLSVFKVIGHQWLWSYEIADCSFSTFPSQINQIVFDSFMIPTSDIGLNQLRLLEVDNPLFVPVETPLVFIVTSDDVLHSWAVPSLGIKIDAVPGRLNQVYCFVTRTGEFYGQCSELCGVHHGFMPIHVISI